MYSVWEVWDYPIHTKLRGFRDYFRWNSWWITCENDHHDPAIVGSVRRHHLEIPSEIGTWIWKYKIRLVFNRYINEMQSISVHYWLCNFGDMEAPCCLPWSGISPRVPRWPRPRSRIAGAASRRHLSSSIDWRKMRKWDWERRTPTDAKSLKMWG